MFGVVICHICAFISNRTRTFEWMIVVFSELHLELSEIHLAISEIDLNYLKSIWPFLKLI